MRAAFKYLAGLVFVGVVVQFGLAGIGAFHAINKNNDGAIAKNKAHDWFGPHAAVGYLILLISLVMLIVALLSRNSSWRNRSALLFGLLIVQVVFAGIGASAWALGFLHPINALAIFGLSGLIVHRVWHGEAAPAAG